MTDLTTELQRRPALAPLAPKLTDAEIAEAWERIRRLQEQHSQMDVYTDAAYVLQVEVQSILARLLADRLSYSGLGVR